MTRRYLERIAAENAVRDAVRQPLVAAANTLADEVRRLTEENATLQRKIWRLWPSDEDGTNGETWQQFATDTDMLRIQAEAGLAEARRLLVKYAGEKGGYPAEVDAFLKGGAA